MEKNKIEDIFRKYLLSTGDSGYKSSALVVKTIWTRGNPFQAIAVYDGDAVIQLFVLMSEKSRNEHRHYPVYLSFRQNPSRYENVYPASYVVTYYPETDSFRFFNASNVEIEFDKDALARILNYKEARIRFKNRVKANPTVKLMKKIKRLSWALALVLSVFLALYAIFSIKGNSLQLDGGIVGMCGLIVFLIILPVLLPLVNKVSFSGFSMGINDPDE